MSKAAELAALIGSQSAQSNRNMIINGAMNVAQRSTSETAQHTTGYITCDRFQLFFANEDELRLTVTQDTDSPSGFSNSFKIQTTTAESAVAADENVLLMQRIEAQDLQQLGYGTSAAKKATVSFYVKSSVAATYGFNAYHSDGNKVFGQSYTISSANTWERKTITIDANTSDAINDDNGIGLQLSWQLVAGTNFTSGSNSSWETNAEAKQAVGHTANAVGTTTNATWQITGVQMELGEQATPFEHRSFADELRRCQRYFWQPDGGANGTGTYGGGANGRATLAFPVVMRAAPTLTYVSGGSSTNNAGLDRTVDGLGSSRSLDNHSASIQLSFTATATGGVAFVFSDVVMQVSSEL
jgi:hypothetical protein